MWRNRICYLIILQGALAFYICFDGYLSFYTLLLIVFLPLVSLLLSLPGMLGVRAVFFSQLAASRKGNSVEMGLTFSNRFYVPSGRAKVTLQVENTLTGEHWEEILRFTASGQPIRVTHKLTAPACGQVECRLKKGWVCDYAGLFSLPLFIGRKAPFLPVLFYPAVHPAKLDLEKPDTPSGEEDGMFAPRPGEDPSELFGLRDYRQGDRASRIHWKLSEKTGQTLVKELGLPVEKRPCYLLEINGSGEESDALLDVFCTLSARMAEQGIPHQLAFLSRGGTLNLVNVDGEGDLLPALETLLTGLKTGSLPAATEGQLPDDISHGLYLCSKINPHSLAALHGAAPGAGISTFQISAQEPEPGTGSDKTVHVRPGHIGDDLSGFRL